MRCDRSFVPPVLAPALLGCLLLTATMAGAQTREWPREAPPRPLAAIAAATEGSRYSRPKRQAACVDPEC